MAMRKTIQRGSTGPDVRTWQQIIGAAVDGVFGAQTDAKTRVWQAAHGLDPDGIVGAKTWAAFAPTRSQSLEPWPFIPARWFGSMTAQRPIRLIVIHTTESPEREGAAVTIARWFESGDMPPDRRVSAHFCIDDAETIRCVHDQDIAWHAGRVNSYSIGVEHVGTARQSPADWRDEYSIRMLARSAELVGLLCSAYLLPPRRLTNAELRAGMPGIVGHVDITRTYNIRGGHTDPGEGFPWAVYLAAVEQAMLQISNP